VCATCCGLCAGILCTHGALTKYIIAVGWDRKVTFFEDMRVKRITSARHVPVGRYAHDDDILACALMLESPNMVTAAADGSLKVWNVDSGSLRKTLSPRASHMPNHRRAIEALACMHGSALRHVCIAVGAEQMVRWWDIKHCVLQHQMFAGALPQPPAAFCVLQHQMSAASCRLHSCAWCLVAVQCNCTHSCSYAWIRHAALVVAKLALCMA
jgi:hypothetical protein